MRSFQSQRGSALITALIFAAIIAISLTSYMKLASTAQRLSNRSFYSDGAENLVDTGLEHTLWSLNNSNNWSGGNFSARSGYAGHYQGKFPSSSTTFNFSGGVTGRVKVWVDASTTTPHAVSQATITLADGTSFIKMAEAYMQKRSYFKNGLVAKNSLTFNGNVMIDSWNSAQTVGTVTPYATGTHHDGGPIASLSVQTQSINVGNADVYGYASVGGTTIADISVGSTGRVGAYGTGNGVIDPTRVTYDFTTNFPDVSAPTTAGVSQSYTLAGVADLPRAGDNPASDGNYYYFFPSISMAGQTKINIAANSKVVMVVSGDISSAGQSAIIVPPTGALTLYAAGNVSFTGNGVVNGVDGGSPAAAVNFQLYGTRTAAQAAISGMQTIGIKGNGYLSGIVYAPNANVSVNGNGDVYGAVVSNQVNMTGNANFHYDESLANFGSSNLWSLVKWRELTSASDRASYSTQLNF